MMTLIEGHTAADLEEFIERAAIMEHLGGFPRDMSERLAVQMVNRKIEQRKATKGAA